MAPLCLWRGMRDDYLPHFWPYVSPNKERKMHVMYVEYKWLFKETVKETIDWPV